MVFVCFSPIIILHHKSHYFFKMRVVKKFESTCIAESSALICIMKSLSLVVIESAVTNALMLGPHIKQCKIPYHDTIYVVLKQHMSA